MKRTSPRKLFQSVTSYTWITGHFTKYTLWSTDSQVKEKAHLSRWWTSITWTTFNVTSTSTRLRSACAQNQYTPKCWNTCYKPISPSVLVLYNTSYFIIPKMSYLVSRAVVPFPLCSWCKESECFANSSLAVKLKN